MVGFCHSASVSVLPVSQDMGGIRRKSLASTANIPVLGRLALENGFDHHCVARMAIDFAH